MWNHFRRNEPQPVRDEYHEMDEHVRRQSWWDTAAEEVLGASPDGKVNLAVWEGVARTIQLRQSENYSKFANNLMNFIGGHLRFETRAEPSVTDHHEQLMAALRMEERLWNMYAEGDLGLPRNGPRRSSWRINNKPSYELAHPMGVLAAQRVEGDRFWCRCVKLPNGEIVAVREHAGEPRMENEEETDETGMMQRTLTKLLGQQSRSRIVLQGLNFRLSNLQGDEAARRARALLVRLTHRFAIAANSRDRQPELVQDAEAILAGHADPELCRGHFGTDADVEFVEAWWKDLIGALNHDLNAGPQPALHCMSHREVQEIERGQESDNENEIARQQWEEYMAEKENAEKLDHQRDDGHETGGEAGPRTAEPECTTGNPSGRAYQQWEDWAMYDEMNCRQGRKRRLHVEVRMGNGQATSSSSTMSCSLQGWNGTQELQVCLRIEREVDVDATLDHGSSPPQEQGTKRVLSSAGGGNPNWGSAEVQVFGMIFIASMCFG